MSDVEKRLSLLEKTVANLLKETARANSFTKQDFVSSRKNLESVGNKTFNLEETITQQDELLADLLMFLE